MPQVPIPDQLRILIAGTDLEGPTVSLAEAVGVVLGDNELPFFPAYTDHGSEHVERVLKAAVRLIPDEVWNGELLAPADGAVLSCAAMLHDLAMNIREPGFVALVGEGSPFEPQQWFSEDREDRSADAPWPVLWSAFQQEARHFGTSQIELILGPSAKTVPGVAYEETLDPSRWRLADRLLIGEFLRRHHARLSHEIAMFGFPGLPQKRFPVLAEKQPLLANGAGVVARSHHEPLRRMLAYLEYLEPGNKRPLGALLLFLMGLLRVADFIQIDADRAPPLLLHLKKPQSQTSIEEWNKHGAVSSVTWNHDDPRAVAVTVSPNHGLHTHLALADLFRDMQHEMDATSAVFDEEFGSGDLRALALTRRRVITNLEEESLRRQLPYIPRRSALRSDPDLFRLVIRDLYGNQPAVAGRELIQNAVDAVRALRAYEERTGRTVAVDQVRQLDADVVVTLEVLSDRLCVLRIADRGIGMKPDLVIKYFLQAGASFGPASEETRASNGTPVSMKAGRFGVGAFAAFLLGPEMYVGTRHVDAERGTLLKAHINEDLVQLDWAELPVGTEIAIPFRVDVIPPNRWEKDVDHGPPSKLLETIAEFYRLRDPEIKFILCGGEQPAAPAAPADVPAPKRKLPDSWRTVPTKDFDSVIWRLPPRRRFASGEFYVSGGGLLAHNGIVIHELADYLGRDDGAYVWSDESLSSFLRRPSLAVFDSRHALGIALHRYGLVDNVLPFERDLLESIGADIVAHGLIAGAKNHPLQDGLDVSPVLSRSTWLPPLPSLLQEFVDSPLLVLWTYNTRPYWDESVPPDPDHYLAPRSTLSWRTFSHRMCISLRAPNSDELDINEFQEWGHSPHGISRAAEQWATRLGASGHCTCVARDDARRVFGPGDGSPKSTKLEEKVISAAAEILENDDSLWVAVTAFSGFTLNRPAHEHLSSAWSRMIGGALPRPAKARAGAEKRALAENRTLAPLLGKWRRSLDKH